MNQICYVTSMSRVAADQLAAEAESLLREERHDEAAPRFERAIALFPQHAGAWKGLGHALLCLGRAHDAARAFDQAIGLAPTSATALWGGALAHAETGNKVVAHSYLRRTLVLQPTWIAMANATPQLQPFLQVAARASDCLHRAFGAFSRRTYRHAREEGRFVEVGRIVGSPAPGRFTFVTVGLANTLWDDPERPRVELVLASTVDAEACGQVLANLAFHLTDTQCFPEPGTIVRDAIGALDVPELSARLPHIYVRAPRVWGLHLPLDVGPPPITLAQAVPISDAEYQTWRGLGDERFERTLLDRGVDVADLTRRG